MKVRRCINYSAIMFFLLGHLQITAQAPYFEDNFESYADSASLSGGNPFGASGNTRASTEQSFSGTTSAKMEIYPENNGGFGNWGGYILPNPTIPKGGEVWVRLAIYWPLSFQFSATPFMKFLRLHNRQADGSNGGYNDLYVNNANSTSQVLQTIKEIHDIWEYYDGSMIPRDAWETYEMYLFVDDVSVDDGGNGRFRIWRDNELIFDRTDVPTITDEGGVIDGFYLFTYWNNENPPHNHVYVDDLMIFTQASPPVNQDENGNSFIGGAILSINDEALNSTISIYPNPANSSFTIDLENETLKKVIIYNNLGQQVKEASTNQVNIVNLPKGIYFVKITSQDGEFTIKKLIRN